MKSKYDLSKVKSVRNPYAAKLNQQQPSGRIMKKRDAQTDAIDGEASDSTSVENEKDTLTQLREAVRLRKSGKGKGRKKK